MSDSRTNAATGVPQALARDVRRESRLLRYLCRPSGDAAERAAVIDALQGYHFRTTEHQVLFDCLKSLAAARPELLESLLPARLVRAGFPDFNLDEFFRPSGLSAVQARTLARALSEK